MVEAVHAGPDRVVLAAAGSWFHLHDCMVVGWEVCPLWVVPPLAVHSYIRRSQLQLTVGFICMTAMYWVVVHPLWIVPPAVYVYIQLPVAAEGGFHLHALHNAGCMVLALAHVVPPTVLIVNLSATLATAAGSSMLQRVPQQACCECCWQPPFFSHYWKTQN